jgi:hypothetical protein
MKTGVVLLLLLSSVSAIAGQMTQQQILAYNECFPILKELKWIKAMRDQNMETGGKKSLAEVEKDWQDRAIHLGCNSYQNEFDRRNH